MRQSERDVLAVGRSKNINRGAYSMLTADTLMHAMSTQKTHRNIYRLFLSFRSFIARLTKYVRGV
jgi:hypothetical protein